MTLFELAEEYRQILELAEEDVDPEIIAFHLDELGGEIEDKADNIAAVIAQLTGDIETIEKEEDRLAQRRKGIKASIDRLKNYLETAMKATGKTKFKTALHSYGIQKNPPSVMLLDGMPVPEQYLIRQEPKVDRKQILADLKAGMALDFAELSQTESLRIR